MTSQEAVEMQQSRIQEAEETLVMSAVEEIIERITEEKVTIDTHMLDYILSRLTASARMGYKEGIMRKFFPETKVSIIVEFLRKAHSQQRTGREEPIPSTSKAPLAETLAKKATDTSSQSESLMKDLVGAGISGGMTEKTPRTKETGSFVNDTGDNEEKDPSTAEAMVLNSEGDRVIDEARALW